MHDECPHSYRAFNEDGIVIRMACDQWSCLPCAKALAWRWAERVRYGIALDGWHDAYFWTLTLPPWVQYAKTGFRLLPDMWDRFRREIQAVYQTWHYAAFVECHPQRNYIPHFHLISLSNAPYRLKDIAVHCGFGYEAWDRQITGKQAAGYVTKYVSKQGYGMPKGFRRVRISYRWPKLPKPAYDKTVYPIKTRESLKAYIRRIAVLTGRGYDELMSSWLDSKQGEQE